MRRRLCSEDDLRLVPGRSTTELSVRWKREASNLRSGWREAKPVSHLRDHFRGTVAVPAPFTD